MIEKLTLFRGCTLSREIHWVTRVRCWSSILTETLTLVDCDCALLCVERTRAELFAALFEGGCAVYSLSLAALQHKHRSQEAASGRPSREK